MERFFRPILSVALAILLLGTAVVWGKFNGLGIFWNTRYAENYRAEKFAEINRGLPFAEVKKLLGRPLRTSAVFGYPAPLSEPDSDIPTSLSYGKIDLTVLHFSEAKGGGDYEQVEVWLDPDQRVFRVTRHFTD